MAENGENQGVEEQEVTQPVESVEVSPFEDPKVKERMGAISAQKNKYKSEAEQAMAQAQALQAEIERLKATTSPSEPPSAPEDDPDITWVREKIVPELAPLLKQMQQELLGTVLPIKDRADKTEFWDGREEAPEVQELVEDMILEARSKGIEANRQHALWLVKGQMADTQVATENAVVEASQAATQVINQNAAVSNGPAPTPEPEPQFSDLSREERWAQMRQSGQLDYAYTGNGNQPAPPPTAATGYMDLRKKKK